jgi:hypothetical protein
MHVNSYMWATIIGVLVFSGCESAFNPLDRNEELSFTMNGLLDVHADTQWVRVMPIGQSLLPTDPAPNGTVVKLIKHSTGETIVLEDSLFKFSNDTFVWNYELAGPISGNESYEIIAEAPNGAQSRAVVNTPSSLSVPDVEYSEDFERISISGTADDTVVVAETRYLVQAFTEVGCSPEREVIISHADELRYISEREFIINSENRGDLASEMGVSAFNFQVNYRQFVLITAGSDWPADVSLSDFEESLPEINSNVEGGTGLVAGIAGRTVEISERSQPCDL